MPSLLLGLYHGGAAGLDVGAFLQPPESTGILGCGALDPICRRDVVYATPSIDEARIYAGLAGGDVYEVETSAAWLREHDWSYMAPVARVVRVVERGVSREVAQQLMLAELQRWLRG